MTLATEIPLTSEAIRDLIAEALIPQGAAGARLDKREQIVADRRDELRRLDLEWKKSKSKPTGYDATSDALHLAELERDDAKAEFERVKAEVSDRVHALEPKLVEAEKAESNAAVRARIDGAVAGLKSARRAVLESELIRCEAAAVERDAAAEVRDAYSWARSIDGVLRTWGLTPVGEPLDLSLFERFKDVAREAGLRLVYERQRGVMRAIPITDQTKENPA